MASCLYVGPNLAAIRVVSHAGLDATTERHRLVIEPGPLTQHFTPLDELGRQPDLNGVTATNWTASAVRSACNLGSP